MTEGSLERNPHIHSKEINEVVQSSDIDNWIATGYSRLVGHTSPASREVTQHYLRKMDGGVRVINNGLRWYLPTDIKISFPNELDGLTQTAKPGKGILFGRLSEERLKDLNELYRQYSTKQPLKQWNKETYTTFLQEAQNVYRSHPINGDPRIDCWPGGREKVEKGVPVDDQLNALDKEMDLGERGLTDYVRSFRNSSKSDLQIVRVRVKPGEEFKFRGVSGEMPQSYEGREHGTNVYLTVGTNRITAVEQSAFGADWRIKDEQGNISNNPPKPDDFVSLDAKTGEIMHTPKLTK